MPKYYRVEQGACISSIAFNLGLLPDTVWNHSENAKLRELRKDRNILLEGDVVYVPDQDIKEISRPTDARHRFRRMSVPDKLRVVIRDDKDEPRQNARYTLTIDGSNVEGFTNDEGLIEQPIPPNAAEARLTLYDGDQETVFLLSLGHLNPITEVSGVQMRLRNLDFYNGPIDGEWNDKTEWAIEEFQTHYGFEPTGVLDDATRSKLEEVHGS